MIFRSEACNAIGENIDFERVCKQKGMGMEFQYTAKSAPQKKDHVEQKFTTLFNQVCAMLESRKLYAFLKNNLWEKPANTAS